MMLFILGIAIVAMIATLVLMTIGQDDYSNWGEEYMDDEFKKLRSK